MLFLFLIACGTCPPEEMLCDEQCVPAIQATAQSLAEDVFSKSCAFSSCHSEAASASAGLSLHNEEALLEMIDKASIQDPNKKLIVPGDPASSYLIDKMRGSNLVSGTDSMPPNATLCESKLELVEAWIESL